MTAVATALGAYEDEYARALIVVSVDTWNGPLYAGDSSVGSLPSSV